MNFRRFSIFLLCISLLGLTSCNTYQKVLKSTDYEFKLAKAIEYYNSGAYTRAVPLIEELIGVYKGSRNLEDLYYYYAWCHYGQGNYIFAAYYFKNFLDYYPRSQLAEEAQYMIARSHYKMSPKSNLDQTYTLKAIDAFQLFVNNYPGSDRVEQCNQLMDELRLKLEDKNYKAAKLYFNVRDYRAAANAFANLLLDFPETEKKEEIHYMIIKSHYLLASNSIQSKKEERFQKVVETYLEFVDEYPKSEFIRDAEKMYQGSRSYLETAGI